MKANGVDSDSTVKLIVAVVAALVIVGFVLLRLMSVPALPTGESAGVAKPLEHHMPTGMPYGPAATAPKAPQPQSPPANTDQWGSR